MDDLAETDLAETDLAGTDLAGTELADTVPADMIPANKATGPEACSSTTAQLAKPTVAVAAGCTAEFEAHSIPRTATVPCPDLGLEEFEDIVRALPIEDREWGSLVDRTGSPESVVDPAAHSDGPALVAAAVQLHSGPSARLALLSSPSSRAHVLRSRR